MLQLADMALSGCCDPRPPRGGRLERGDFQSRAYTLRSTPPSRGATPGQGQIGLPRRVAIHAPLAGGDVELTRAGGGTVVAIHAPLAGGDILLGAYLVRE